MSRFYLIIFYCFGITNMFAQHRWSNNYFEGENPFGESIIEDYDGGYLITGRYGSNYPSYNWLLKTDVNGEILWKKVLGMENSITVLTLDVGLNAIGCIYLAGSTYYYGEEDSDPLIMKLNACGEKEWCRIFLEDGNNFAESIVVTPDNGVVVMLRYMHPLAIDNRICLAKFNSDGDMLWMGCYNSSNLSIHNEDGNDLTLASDGGFLITGDCGYEDPNPPHVWWSKPYYIKTDSQGNLEWEKVVHGEISDKGGVAWSTVLSPDSNYYYSSLSHYYHPPYGDAPALLKMDLNGNIVEIYDITPINEYGKMIQAKFINDSTLMASAVWGNSATPNAVILDTFGNIIYQANLLDNEWMAATEVTFDKKLLFLTNIQDENDNFETYLFKLNQQLESDTLYTQLFNYDSLCPHQIAWDTIVQDNCGLIVGDEEIKVETPLINFLKIFPNPAGDYCIIEYDLSMFEGETNIAITDLYGRNLLSFNPENMHTQKTISLAGFSTGIYFVTLAENGNRKESIKLIVIK